VRHFLERPGGYLPAAVALALPVLFIPTASDSFILPRASAVLAGAGVGLGVALLVSRGPSLGALRWPLAAAAAAAVLAFAFSISWPLGLAGSYTRYESLPVRLGYLGLLAMAAWLLRSERARQLVAVAFVLGTSIACLEAVSQWAGHAPFRPDGNLGNANLLAALVAMAMPVAVAHGLRRWDPWAIPWWAAVVVMGEGLFVSTSRSGALGALAGCLAVVVFMLRGRRAAVAAGLSAAAVGVAVLAIVVSPLNALNSDPASLRANLWRDGLSMVAARPLTGWGEDTTGLALGRFLSRDYASLVTFDRVHSGPLDIAATQGILGLAALGWVLFVLFRAAWRHRHEGEVGALAAGLAGYSVWVVFNFDWAPATGAFWLLAGTAWSGIQAARPGALEEPAPRPGWWRAPAAVALVAAATVTGVLPVLADVWYQAGRADLSVKADPLQAQYHWSLGQALVGRADLAGGVAELQRAADLGETEPSMYVELGDREMELGRRSAAIGAYRRALAIDPYYRPAQQRLTAAGA